MHITISTSGTTAACTLNIDGHTVFCLNPQVALVQLRGLAMPTGEAIDFINRAYEKAQHQA